MNYRNLTAEEQSKITAPRVKSEGATFVKYIAIKPENIHIRAHEKGGNNNVVRKQMNYAVCNAIAHSYRNNGQLLHLPIPVVREDKPFTLEGKRFCITGVDIHHRKIGAEDADLPELICAVYEFDSEQSEVKFQLKSNDQAPSNPISADDICNTLCVAVNKGWIPNTEDAMREFVKDILHCHGNTKNKGIKEAIRLCGTFVDFQTWTQSDIEKYVANVDNYTDEHFSGFSSEGSPQYVTGGHLDQTRDATGWSVKEGYEQEFVYNAAKKFRVEGERESYFLCHTKTPTEKQTVDSKRKGMVEKFSSIEKDLLAVFAFYQKYNRFPWHVEAFLPQDNSRDESDFLFL